MAENTSDQPSRFPGAPSLALTFLFAGMGYALPILLYREAHPLHGAISSEILNLNFLVAWMGLSHFVFAYHGQAKALKVDRSLSAFFFLGGLAVSAGLLLLLKCFISSRIFDFLIWIYFIPHFIKAELHFAKQSSSPTREGWVLYWFPALAFAFLTLALFGPIEISLNTTVLLCIACACVLAGMLGGIRPQLYTENAKYALLAFFFIGEALVWGTYSKYMTEQFRQGVYVFHVAVASFYHYFRAYGFALRKMVSPSQTSVAVGIFVLVNVAMIGIGFLSMHQNEPGLARLFDVRSFTFWVGLHLLASDLFTVRRRLHKKQN